MGAGIDIGITVCIVCNRMGAGIDIGITMCIVCNRMGAVEL